MLLADSFQICPDARSRRVVCLLLFQIHFSPVYVLARLVRSSFSVVSWSSLYPRVGTLPFLHSGMWTQLAVNIPISMGIMILSYIEGQTKKHLSTQHFYFYENDRKWVYGFNGWSTDCIWKIAWIFWTTRYNFKKNAMFCDSLSVCSAWKCSLDKHLLNNQLFIFRYFDRTHSAAFDPFLQVKSLETFPVMSSICK